MNSLHLNADKLFFTSDPHFWHKKAAQMRSYPDEHAMNADIIQNWNNKVPKDAHVIVTGDFSFAGASKTIEVLEMLNGSIHLVRGNHDKGLNASTLASFTSVHYLLNLKAQQANGDIQRIFCCHFPMMSWDMQHHGAWHVHGHSHGSLKGSRGKMMDVGVDPNGMTPVSFSELKAKMDQVAPVSPDYHKIKID